MKRVVKNKFVEVNIEDIDSHKLYCFIHKFTYIEGVDICKLHMLNDGEFAFISFDNSYHLEFKNKEMRDCILEAMKEEDVYEFKDQKEFLEWALKELNK